MADPAMTPEEMEELKRRLRARQRDPAINRLLAVGGDGPGKQRFIQRLITEAQLLRNLEGRR